MYYIVLMRYLSLYILTSINIYGTGIGRHATAQRRLHFEKQFAGAQTVPFSYPELFLRAVRRGALAKSITGYHKNMVRKQYPVLELANQMPVWIWFWPEPLVAPRVRRALGTRMELFLFYKFLIHKNDRVNIFGFRSSNKSYN
jgi:hypothetical protein